ncbi:MAG: 2-dehydropantoate 2-reductase [Bradymonadales bacterium]|nr:2-dehydropantoate 2-reductase [Bradymonadales bacterium]
MERILIEGIGGIGGVIAARLVRAEYQPVLVTHNDEITAAINTHGLRVTTPRDVMVVPTRAYTSIEEVASLGPFDAAFLMMKATSLLDAARETKPLLQPETGFFVTFQNGIVQDALVELVGAGRVLSAIVGWGGTMQGAGIYQQTSEGTFHIGELDGGTSERLDLLKVALSNVCPVVVTRNIRGALWTKLAINCTITTLGALTGATLGEMLKEKRVRRAFLAIYSEVVNTAWAQGIKLEKVAANPKLLYLKPNAGRLTRYLKDKLVCQVGKRYGQLKSSSLQSLERGRPTEIDFLNGYVVHKAEEAGLKVPLNTTLVRLIKELESQKRQIGPDNLAELLAVMR